MYLALKKILVVIIVCCAFTKTNAQQTISTENRLKLAAYQDTLSLISEETFTAVDDSSLAEKNTQFVKKFIAALKTPGSFNYDFDSLKRISILKSPDNAFRIITWFTPTHEGSYRYYGTIQMPTTNGSLKLIPLTDGTKIITDQNAITTQKNWLGARYYELLPVIVNGKQPYYLLLGWKGNDQKTTKKVIDVLSFEKDEAIFGKNIFETAKNSALKNRVVFEYAKLNTMTLTVDKKVNMIVFDHLVPYDPKMVGKFEFYASDSTFDGYKITYGKLSIIENVELKNEASATDEFYGRPVKASVVNSRQN